MDDVHWMEEAAARAPREARRMEKWIRLWFKEFEDEYSKDRPQRRWFAAEKHAQLALVTRATITLIDEIHCYGGTVLWLHAKHPPLYCVLELFAAITGTPRERLYSARAIESDWPLLARAAGVLSEEQRHSHKGRTLRVPAFSLGHVDNLAEVEKWVSSKKLLPPSKKSRVLIVDGMERLEEVEGVSGDLAKTEELHRHIKSVASKNGVKAILRSSFADEEISLNSGDCRFVNPIWESFNARAWTGTT